MLTHLHIKNFTIVNELALDVHTGMTAITGETGAGKSIMIDALELCLGARADSTVVRPNAPHCEITAHFSLEKLPHAQRWLQEHEYSTDECILRRSINRDGPSRSYINGTAATLGDLREFSSLLVNIYGQHEHQSLLKTDMQLQLVDHVAGSAKLLAKLATCCQQWQATTAEIAKIHAQQGDEARRTLLEYQVQELAELALTEHELTQLNQDHKKLAHAENDASLSQAALNLLAHDDDNIIDRMHGLTQRLAPALAHATQFKNAADHCDQALIYLREAQHELEHYQQAIDIDPARLQTIELRLQKIHDVARKHHVNASELPQLTADLQQQLLYFSQHQQHLAELTARKITLQNEYVTHATQLSKLRERAIKTFNQQITTQLQDLGMPNAQFSVRLIPRDDTNPHATGMETALFLFTSNPGLPPQALHKIASGGELSRVALAIQVITAQRGNIGTLCFDEVDVGVGGTTAAKVGQRLRALAEHTQVICITHQPQVAALTNEHWQVSKHVKSGETFTKVALLDKNQRVQEIARMLAGVRITEQTIAHAREMLEEA